MVMMAQSYTSFTVMRQFDQMVCCVDQKICDLLRLMLSEVLREKKVNPYQESLRL